MIYYSHGTEEHAKYVNSHKERFGVDHVHIHTLRADWKEIESYKEFGAENVHMMSSLGTGTHRPYTEDEIEMASFLMGIKAKAYMGMVNDPLTRMVFEKRATHFKTDDTNFI